MNYCQKSLGSQGNATEFIIIKNVSAQDLRSIKSVYVSLNDFATGGCWTNLREVREYAEEKLRTKGIKTTDDGTIMDAAFDATPNKSFNPAAHVMPASEPTRLLSDGDNIDLGDRIFEVVHLPGVTDGASGLFERASGLLFTGEAFVWSDEYIYEGEPANRCKDADLKAFRNSIRRLISLPVTTVYRGHYGRSNAETMKAVGAAYLAGWNSAVQKPDE